MAPTTTPASATRVPITFKAYQYEGYGNPADVLRINPATKQPVLGEKQVRVRVHAAALNPADAGIVEIYGELATGSKPTVDRPYRIGFDASGVVVEIGGVKVKDGADAAPIHGTTRNSTSTHLNNSRLHVGDEVYFMTPFTSFGTFAEFVDVDEAYVALKPTNLSFEEVAGIPAVGLTSYQALIQHAQLKRGERVLILGGSSATGIVGIQIAKKLGAHVTATTSSRNTAFVKSLGADDVVDYTQRKWVDALAAHSIDVVYDCGVEPNSWNGDAQLVLKRDSGRFVTLHPVADPVASKFGAKFVGHIHVAPSLADLDELTQLVEAGELKLVVDVVYPFEHLAVAIARIKTRRAVGKLVLKVVADA